MVYRDRIWYEMEEGLYSSVKRIFGESVKATSKESMMREAMMKLNCYNMILNLN